MNKKILLLVLIQICMFATESFAQSCVNTTCITDQHVSTGATNWYTSHGTVSFPNNNAPTSPSSSNAVSMWSYMNTGSGAFTCYNFEKDSTYRVCFWVRNNSPYPGNPWGRLYVYAASGLSHNGYGYPVTPPSVSSKQLIDQSYFGPGAMMPNNGSPWEFVSVTFKANYDHNVLWFYPVNPEGPPPPGPVALGWDIEYRVEVDDIRVTKESTPPAALSVAATKDPITGCNDQTQISITGMPTNTVAIWTPAVTQVATDWSVVIAKPCTTTTYKIEVADPTAPCGICTREVLYYTVNVNQWSDPSRIIYPTSVIPCTDTFDLEYDPDPGNLCSQIGFNDYVWTEPDGITTHTGRIVTINGANAYQTGEWTLTIYNSVKGCSEEHKFIITVGSCCMSYPSFTVVNPGGNPIIFNNTGTGITNHVATLWNFGDGTTSDLKDPIHTYSAAGTYTVCLTMLFEDGQGESCCDRVCQTVQAGANTHGCAVTANFTYNSPWFNNFDFTDASSGNGVICDYEWNFGDGTILNTTVPTINHNYSIAGPWWVCLTVTNCIYDASGALIKTCKNKKCMWVDPENPFVKQGSGDPQQQAQPRAGDAPLMLGTSTMNGTGNGNLLTIYPNPNQGTFAMILNKRTGNYNVIVRDKLGHEVYNRAHIFDSAPVKIALSDLPSGIYSVEVMNNKEKLVQQITITR